MLGRSIKTRYSGVDINLSIREGLTFYQTRSNAIILQGTLPAHCIPKVERLKTGETLYERRYLSRRPPPKISVKHDHNWTKGNAQSGSTVEQQPVGRLVQQSVGEAPRAEFSKPTQSKPNPICDRSGKPVEANTHSGRILVLPNIVTLHHQTRTSSTLQPMRRTSTSTSQVCRTRW